MAAAAQAAAMALPAAPGARLRAGRPPPPPARARRPPRRGRGRAATASTTSGLEIDGARPTSPKAWAQISAALRASRGFRMVNAQEVAPLQRRAVLLDVRPAGEYAASRLPGAASAPFYREITGWGPIKIARRALFAFFGVLNGTEYNDAYCATALAAAGGDKRTPLVLYCLEGGQLEPWGSSEAGRQSRSLMAAYELLRAGHADVAVLHGGLREWEKAGRPLEGG